MTRFETDITREQIKNPKTYDKESLMYNEAICL